MAKKIKKEKTGKSKKVIFKGKKKIKKALKKKPVLRKSRKVRTELIDQTVDGKLPELSPIHQVKIKVIGIGGGACSIVSDIAFDYKGTSYILADSDRLSLSRFKHKKGVKIFQFGEEMAKGMGAGMDVNFGRQVAEKEKEKIAKLLEGTDLCVLVACLGGGTSCGGTAVFAQTAKDLKITTYGIFTLPFDFEREKKLAMAKEALKSLAPLVSAMSVVPNERIFKIVDYKMPLKSAMATINRFIGGGLGGVIEMTCRPGLINIDFADIKAVINGGKPLAYLTRSQAQGKERAKEVLDKVLNDPLYPYGITKADRLLFNIVGPADLSLSETASISQGISSVAEKGSKVIFGVETGRSIKGIEVTLLAVGCEMGEFLPEKDPMPRKAKTIAQHLKPVQPPKENKEEKEPEIKVKQKPLFFPKLRKEPKKPRVRKNALQVQKDLKAVEKELLEKEEAWESPAFLRTKETTQKNG